MDFLFFNAADSVLFSRDDAESANWTVQEKQLIAEFPYVVGKTVQRGMRIGFKDEDGVWQLFEIRKCETMEPDHYQRVTAEHIVISELTDEHFAGAQVTSVTAQAALTSVLTGTLWQVGTVTASGTSSADFSVGSVWQCVLKIETDWNVYITPRVTVGASGITGRYLDIAPAEGVWRGLYLTINKNMDEVGVTWDDSNVITAMYGYGANVNDAPLTFADVVWSATSSHPAKPSGQTYIEDAAATAAYGRNGRKRWGFYQNSNVSDAETLLQLTWQALSQTNAPKVTVDCMVRDLKRMGLPDVSIRLHDTAQIYVEPTGERMQLEVIALEVDLLDPTATRPTIGTYIPNIIYIDRQTAQRAGGGGRGVSNGRGQTAAERQLSEFNSEILANKYQISLRAYQIDMDNVEDILRQAGISINAQGVITYADDNINMWQSKLNVEANRIGLVVQGSGANASIKAASIVTAINSAGSSVVIDADHIYLKGTTTADSIFSSYGSSLSMDIGRVTADESYFESMEFGPSGYHVYWQSLEVVTDMNGNTPVKETIYYLGRTVS